MNIDENLSNQLNEDNKDLLPQNILEHSINNIFRKKLVYVCSFGTESAIILHMISEIDRSLPIAKCLGVKWLLVYLDKNISLEEAVRLSKRDTRRYVKRQS